ncbi:MAG: glycosyl transferase family 1 [Candidatus Pelagibacter sp. TMED64]|nr:glycosyl transferase family 1 [Candidatus Pelagibacter sp.]OUU66204.1 MAG: glycosyl transferase family 1 [Candidatus Pelagibacter sp. TMED64]|tara:strand:+ start:682 stop:1827 length:1146 start_codon:yes stop_codon:yes gene_type:complete
MNILQVIPKLGFGGAETGCFDLAHYLYEKNCKSFIATGGGDLIKYINKDKVKVFKFLVHSKNPLIILINTFILIFIIVFYKIDIVHARSRAPAWSCLVATKITGIKFVTTFHGTYNFNNKIKKFYNSIMVRSDLVIAGSNFIFSHVSSNYKNFFDNNKRKLMVIFRGINTNYFDDRKVSQTKKDSLYQKTKIEKDFFKILLPGRITKWKGHKVFLEALNILSQKENTKPFVAIILGSDQGRTVYKKELISLVSKYKLNQKVKFIDKCESMPVIYSIADIVISSSIEPEAFGRVSVEAQSMRKPIIASNLGGSKETIMKEKSGYLYDSKNPNDLADIIYSFMNMSLESLKSFGIEGRKNILKKFDVEKMCNTTFTEYNKLIS